MGYLNHGHILDMITILVIFVYFGLSYLFDHYGLLTYESILKMKKKTFSDLSRNIREVHKYGILLMVVV